MYLCTCNKYNKRETQILRVFNFEQTFISQFTLQRKTLYVKQNHRVRRKLKEKGRRDILISTSRSSSLSKIEYDHERTHDDVHRYVRDVTCCMSNTTPTAEGFTTLFRQSGHDIGLPLNPKLSHNQLITMNYRVLKHQILLSGNNIKYSIS